MAAGVLSSLGAANRQLSKDQQRLILGFGLGQSCVVLLGISVGLLAMFLGGITLIFFALNRGRADPTPFLFFGLPALCMFAAVVTALVYMTSRRNRIYQACAAVPPEGPGETALCHVCGANLQPQRTALVRCGYCSADNVVDPTVVRRFGTERTRVFDDYATAVRKETAAVGSRAGVGAALILGSLVLSPIAGCMATMVIGQIRASIEEPPAADARFVVVDTLDGACIAKQGVTSEELTTLTLGGLHSPGVLSWNELSVPKETQLHAKAFNGKKVRYKVHATKFVEGKIVRVISTAADPYTVLAVMSVSDKEESHPLDAVCLVDGVGTLPHIPWPTSREKPPASGSNPR